jgi:hypothetical protein
MKRIVLCLFVILLVSGSMSLYAQKGRRGIKPPVVADLAISYESMSAISQGQGVLIRWHTSVEAGNLGFNVYRVTAQGRERVNPNLITGSVYRRAMHGHTGEEYRLFDTAGGLASVYVIENRFLGGELSSTQPFGVRYVKSLLVEAGMSQQDLEAQVASRNGNVIMPSLTLTQELLDVINSAQPEPDINTHRWVVSQPGAKIGVKSEGFYRVTRAQLEAVGFNVNSNAANWRLFMEGVEQAINVGGTGDYIEFYGKGLDTPESDTRVYYLLADSTPGKRIQQKIITNIGGSVQARSFRSAITYRERRDYNGFILNGDLENYFGRPVTSGPMGELIQVFVSGLDTAGTTASIRVRLQGLPGAAPHNIKVTINGNEAGFVTGVGGVSYQATLSIPVSFLVEGVNLIDLVDLETSGASYFDQVEIAYPRLFAAAGDRLNSFTPGYRKVDVGGFTTSNIRVFDTTYPGLPQEIVGLTVVQDGSTFTAKLPSHRSMVIYAAENNAFLPPSSVTFNNPSTLNTREHDAQFMLISHSAPDFIAAAQQWAAYRASTAGGRFTTKVVDVADIFDEYSYGSSSSKAIFDFLNYARHQWQVAPGYVLFLGDSSYDPRNYEGSGAWNLVPTKFVNLLFEEAGSDEALLDFNHDGLADIPVGRIPARSAFFVSLLLNKTMGFETPVNQSFDRGGLCVYDRPDGFDFEGMCRALWHELPTAMPKTFVSVGLPPPNHMTPDPQGNANVMAAMNTGQYVVNFSGHGSPGIWGSSAFFSADHAPLLTNGPRQSLFTMLTCRNGVFYRPHPIAESVSERLLFAQNGGGAMTWASTTGTTPDFQFIMGSRYFQELAAGNLKRVGDQIKTAKSTIAGSDVGYSWVLLGDPALKVR